MIIKAFTAISAVILEAFDVYCEGDFKWNCGYVASYSFVILMNISNWPDIGIYLGLAVILQDCDTHVVKNSNRKAESLKVFGIK